MNDFTCVALFFLFTNIIVGVLYYIVVQVIILYSPVSYKNQVRIEIVKRQVEQILMTYYFSFFTKENQQSYNMCYTVN